MCCQVFPIMQEPNTCLGACLQLFEGRPCYRCHDPDPSMHNCSFALDLGNARCALQSFEGNLCSKVEWCQHLVTHHKICFCCLHAPHRSAAVIDMVPTFTTNNERMCLLLANGDIGMLRTEDAERLQGFAPRWTEGCYPVMQQGVQSCE